MVKSADDHAIVGNGEGVIEKLVHSDGATSEVDSLAVASQLKRELLELDGVVIANHALVTNGQEHGEVLQMDGRKGALWLRRPDGKASIKRRNKNFLEVTVCFFHGANARCTKLLGEPSLKRSKGPLTSSSCLWRTSQDVPDAKCL